MNGNPVRCLLEDGLPGANIGQIGLAPFANTTKMHEDAAPAGIGSGTIADCGKRGHRRGRSTWRSTLLTHVEAIFVDFDIDVIDRAQLPGAPGARPGGLPPADSSPPPAAFAADPRPAGRSHRIRSQPRRLRHHRPDRRRWVCEVLAGYAVRGSRRLRGASSARAGSRAALRSTGREASAGSPRPASSRHHRVPVVDHREMLFLARQPRA